MNKNDFISVVETKTGFTKKDIGTVLDAILDTIVESVANDKTVSFVGFGKFEKTIRGARKGVNPSTGESIEIQACAAPKFKAGTAFKQAVR